MKTCGIHQFFLSSALDRGGRLPWLTRRHLDRCASCRTIWGRLNHVHGLLAEKGTELRVAAGKVPATIMRPEITDGGALDSVKAQPLRRTSSWRPMIAMAVATLVLIIGIRLIRPVPDLAEKRQSRAVEDVRQRIGTLTENMSRTSLEDPLERELQGLIGTARSAAGYLQKKVKKATGLSDNGS